MMAFPLRLFWSGFVVAIVALAAGPGCHGKESSQDKAPEEVLKAERMDRTALDSAVADSSHREIIHQADSMAAMHDSM